MHVTTELWLITIAVMVVLLGIDLFYIGRKPHEPSMKEAGIAIGVFSSLAVLFGLGLGVFAAQPEPGEYFHGWLYAGQFFIGWVTEYSLSVDNLFVFILIMANLRVPKPLQQFALMVGILLALIFRGVFIWLGSAAIEAFSWTFFIFGGFLIYTAVKLYLGYLKPDEDEEYTENAVMRWVRRTFPASDDFNGTKLTLKQGRSRLITPMLFVIVALGTTDLLFALDSIPAIFGITTEPYLVFTANVFALMGLRQLYFLIGGLLERMVYLSVGLAVILGFIGVKLVLEALTPYGVVPGLSEGHGLPIWVSLAVILGTLLVTVLASLMKSRRVANSAE
jgi:tellurite resistance protein TerC